MSDYSTIPHNEKYIYTKNGKVGGIIRGDTLRKKVRREHFYRKYNGWSCDKYVLKQARKRGIFNIEVRNVEEGVTYCASIYEFVKHGIEINHSGFGEQICLPLSYWRKIS